MVEIDYCIFQWEYAILHTYGERFPSPRYREIAGKFT